MIQHFARPSGFDAPGAVRIYPTAGSTGLWDVDGAAIDPEADLALPPDLVARLRRWIRDYEIMCEPNARVDARVLAAFDNEGLVLGEAVKAHLGPGRRVFVAPEAQYHMGEGPKWVEF
jgi:hypothetical protein